MSENQTIEEAKQTGAVIGSEPEESHLSDAEVEQQTEEVIEATPEGEAEVTEVELPERFKGKSVTDVVDMYRNLETQMGRQSNELGEYRRMFDEYILKNANKQQQTNVSEEDLYNDPQKYTELLAAQTKQEVLKEVPQIISQHESRTKLDRDFPDREQIILSPDFQSWAVSNIPQSVLQQGQTDPGVAHYVLSQYAMVAGKNQAQQQAEANKTVRTQAASQAAGVPASGKTGGKKVWTRTEIARLMKEDPEEYKAKNPEIIQAYKEGRVKSG